MPVTTMDLGSGSGTLEWYGFRQPLDSNGSNQGTQPNCERVHKWHRQFNQHRDLFQSFVQPQKHCCILTVSSIPSSRPKSEAIVNSLRVDTNIKRFIDGTIGLCYEKSLELF